MSKVTRQYRRIGNDTGLAWTITDSDGNDYSLEGKTLTLRMVHAKHGTAVEISDFAVKGNAIGWTFVAAQQKHLGDWIAVLSWDGHIIDSCYALTLVAHSYQEGGSGDIDVTTVQLTGEVLYVQRGYSAYEVAVLNGYSGTETDFVHSLEMAANVAYSYDKGYMTISTHYDE